MLPAKITPAASRNRASVSMIHASRIPIFLAALCTLVPQSASQAADGSALSRPQVVIISFDGAQDVELWQRSRSLAARTGARFTYFLSCAFLLTPEAKSHYKGPRNGTGRSNVGFAASREEVGKRLSQIRLAASEGHEIASHGCGHFDGGNWKSEEWSQEFASFARVLRDAYEINGISPEPDDWRSIAGKVAGFRAPYLSTGPGLYAALTRSGFVYDASGVSRGPVQAAEENGTVRYRLPQIPEGPSGRSVIAMDYNLFVRHSGGDERPDEAATFERRAYEAFRSAFDEQMAGDRIPLQIGYHFALMNGGAYWRALERFAAEVCVLNDVSCISYADDMARRSAHPGVKSDARLGG